MSKGSKRRGSGGNQRQRQPHQHNRSTKKPRYVLQFTQNGRDSLARIFGQYRDRPLYYVLDEQGEPVPLGKSYLLTAEERTRWRAFQDDLAAWLVEEMIIPHPEHPD